MLICLNAARNQNWYLAVIIVTFVTDNIILAFSIRLLLHSLLKGMKDVTDFVISQKFNDKIKPDNVLNTMPISVQWHQ